LLCRQSFSRMEGDIESVESVVDSFDEVESLSSEEPPVNHTENLKKRKKTREKTKKKKKNRSESRFDSSSSSEDEEKSQKSFEGSPDHQLLIQLTKSLTQDSEVMNNELNLKKMERLVADAKDQFFLKSQRITFLETYRDLYKVVYGKELSDFHPQEIIDRYDSLRN
jgi:spore cortex formation protein SpoVR/YcgB (stage V sporulation)